MKFSPSKLPLRLSIPLILVLSALVIMVLGVVLVLPGIKLQQNQVLHQEASQVINRLQGTLGYMLAKQDLDAVKREIMLSAAPEHVKKIALLDEENRIIFSSAERASSAANADSHIHIDLSNLDRARVSEELIAVSQVDENTLYFLSRISNSAIDDNSQNYAVILLELSADPADELIRQQIVRLVSMLAVTITILVLLLIYLVNSLVSNRIERLVKQTQSFSKGEKNPYFGWEGQDEIGQLGRAFANMAQQIGSMHSEQRNNAVLLDQLLNNSPSMIAIRSKEGIYLKANPSYTQLVFQDSVEEIIGKSAIDCLADDMLKAAIEEDQNVLETGTSLHSEVTVKVKGKEKALINSRFPLFDENNEVYAVCNISTDITERIEREKELRLAHYIFETTNDGIVVTDEVNCIVDVNPSFEKVTGYTRDEIIGQNPNILSSNKQTQDFYQQMWSKLDENGIWSGEIWNRKKSGEVYPEWLTIKAIVDQNGTISGYFGVFTDISEHKKTEDSLRSLAYYDPLTNLANRTFCMERLTHDMTLADRHNEALALVFIDLDFFKHVNDTLGHEYGDQLLREAADRIKEHVRKSDTVVRWGGDEFILILPGIFQETMALVIATNVRNALKRPFRLKGHDIYVGASIGVAVYPHDAQDSSTLIKHADAAMYDAKSKGRDQICFFDPQLNEKNLEQIRLKTELREALNSSEFEVYYQPKICLQNLDVTGMEALIRWNKGDGSQVSPADFIPVAETSGLIVPIGEWVLKTVCQQMVSWIDQGLLDNRRISVNLSPKQLMDPGLLLMIQECLELKPGLENYLSLEITETAVISNIDQALPILERIRETGVIIELDDFGSGYSSLNYLRQLPVDVLKVDKSFIAFFDQNEADKAIMEAIINMAHSLSMGVVAEGVETQSQLELLQGLGCETAQGFYFARPQPASELEQLLINQK